MSKQEELQDLTKALSGFVRTLLWSKFDSPVNSPAFHYEMWEEALKGILGITKPRLAIAAPRSHAKSTAITHALTLFVFLFRLKDYGIIVSDTEPQASLFLGDIKIELLENIELRQLFGVKRLIRDAVTDIIVEMDDGHQFRIQAVGMEQKVRGRKWRNKRPNYIICDDMENDELVESDDRRIKSRNWVFKSLIPSLSKRGWIGMVGTILHLDAILMRMMNNNSWEHLFYKAHAGFDDFSNILWEEQWPESGLRTKRQEYVDDNYAEGYAQEYLNDPTAHSEAFFKEQDFLPLEDEMRSLSTTNYAAMDFAISDQDKSAYNVITVGAMDSYGRLIIKHVNRFRSNDSNEILENIFMTQTIYNIEMWKMEDGQILKALMGEIYNRMNSSGVYLNISPGTPVKNKRGRARPIQARMRAGGVYFDKEAEWFHPFKQELLQFPKSPYKDQVDSLAWLGIAINELSLGSTNQELEQEEYNNFMETEYMGMGRNETTGY